jgi:DNA-directed RNA polymerase specialized sigma24 family protein
MAIWDKLDDPQYLDQFTSADPQVLREVLQFSVKYVGNKLASEHKDIRQYISDITQETFLAIHIKTIEGIKNGNPMKFRSRAAYLKYLQVTSYRKAIDCLRKLATEKERYEQLDTGVGDKGNDESMRRREKLAGGKSQVWRASQDVPLSTLLNSCRRFAFDLLKKEDKYIITEIMGTNAEGNLDEDQDLRLDFEEYARRLGKGTEAVKRAFYRAKERWWKNFTAQWIPERKTNTHARRQKKQLQAH